MRADAVLALRHLLCLCCVKIDEHSYWEKVEAVKRRIKVNVFADISFDLDLIFILSIIATSIFQKIIFSSLSYKQSRIEFLSFITHQILNNKFEKIIDECSKGGTMLLILDNIRHEQAGGGQSWFQPQEILEEIQGELQGMNV